MLKRDKVWGFFGRPSSSLGVGTSSPSLSANSSTSFLDPSPSVSSSILLPTTATPANPVSWLTAPTIAISYQHYPITALSPIGQLTPVDDYSTSLWKHPFNTLPGKDQAALAPLQGDYRLVLSTVLKAVQDQKEICEAGRLKFTWKGEILLLGDITDRAISWVERFIKIGDTVVQYDPVHSALPWAGLRFLLQVAVNRKETRGVALVGIEKISKLLFRCRIYGELYIRADPKPAVHEVLAKELTELYAEILKFLIDGKRNLEKGVAASALSGTLDTRDLKELLGSIDTHEITVSNTANLAEAECRGFDARRLEGFVGGVQDGVRALKIMLQTLDKPIQRIDSTVVAMYKIIEDRQRNDILGWLSRIEYIQHHEEAQNGILKKTGEWLLAKQEFKSWQDSDQSSILWLHGIPGAGKTKLTSMVIQRLIQGRKDTHRCESIAYFYCNRGEPARRDPLIIFSAIVKQLVVPGLGLPKPILSKYKARKDEDSLRQLTLDESRELIISLVDIHPKTTIIIDALDETDPGRRQELLNTLEEIVSTSKGLLKIFVSSRDDNNISRKLENLPNLYIEASDNEEDIRSFVNREVTKAIDEGCLLHGIVPDELRQRIIFTLTSGARGMFLWASLQVKYLCEFDVQLDVDENLGKLPETLEATYSQLYEKIKSQKAHGKALGTKALMWLMCFREPPRPAAWVTAVSSPSSKAAPEIKNLTAKILLKLCHNLVMWDHQSNVIRFAHLSVREFIEKDQPTSAATSNLMAANCCLTFLATPEHWLGHPSVPDFLPATGFHAYVVQNLMFHIRNCYEYGVGQQLSDLPHFLESLAYSEWIKMAEDFIYDQDIYQGEELEGVLKHLRSQPLNILFAWSYLGNEEEFNRLYDPGVPGILYHNEIGESLLFIACMEGHEPIVKTLLDNNVNVNAGGDSYTGSPLRATIRQGNTMIFQMLLDHGATLEVGGGHDRSLLAEVVETGTAQMLVLALQKYHHDIAETIMEAAARNQRHGIEIIKILLQHTGQIPLTNSTIKAAADNQTCGRDILELLFAQHPNTKITEAMLLEVLTYQCVPQAIEFLLSRNVEVKVSEALVVRAARLMNKEIVDILLARDNDLLITEEAVMQTWFYDHRIFESLVGRVSVISKNLLQQAFHFLNGENLSRVVRRRDPNIEINETLLTAAAKYSSEATDILLAEYCDITITTGILAAAASNPCGKGPIEALLRRIERPVEICERILMEATKNPNKDVIKFLLNMDSSTTIAEAMVTASNSKGVIESLLTRSGNIAITEAILASAAENSDKTMMELLLRRAADPQITETILKAAAGNYDVSDMEYILSKSPYIKITEATLVAATTNKDINVMRLLLSKANDIAITERLLASAISSSTGGAALKVLVRSGRAKITERTLINAVSTGRQGERQLRLLLGQNPDTVITGRILTAAANFHGPTPFRYLLSRLGHKIITMDFLLIAAQNKHLGQLLVKSFDLEITEASLVEVILQGGPNNKVLKFLYLTKPDNIQVTDAVLVAAAKQEGKEVLELLLTKCEITQTPEAVLVAAARNESEQVFQFLLLAQSDNIQITEAVLIAAVTNKNSNGILLLFEQFHHINITEAILVAAARASSPGDRIFGFLLDKCDNTQLTEAVLVAAVSRYGMDTTVLGFLLAKSDNIRITEAVLVAAACGSAPRIEMLEYLLAKCDNIRITEAILVAAASGNIIGPGAEVLEFFLAKCDNIQLTEAVLVAAVSRYGMNTTVLGSLLAKWGKIKITELVLMAAFNHRRATKEMLEFLLGQSDSIQVTENVLVAAATKADKSTLLMIFQKSFRVSVSGGDCIRFWLSLARKGPCISVPTFLGRLNTVSGDNLKQKDTSEGVES